MKSKSNFFASSYAALMAAMRSVARAAGWSKRPQPATIAS